MKNPDTGQRLPATVGEFKNNYVNRKVLSLPTSWDKTKGEPYIFSFGIAKARAIVEYFDDIKRFVETNGTMQEPPL